MKLRQLAASAAFVAALMASSTAFAQPETKLTGNLPQATIDAIWCSALFLEESYYWDEGSEDAVYYEDMAYDLGDELDGIMGDMGLPYVESEEIWSVFDDAAADLALYDEDAFLDQLDACDEAYQANKLKLR